MESVNVVALFTSLTVSLVSISHGVSENMTTSLPHKKSTQNVHELAKS